MTATSSAHEALASWRDIDGTLAAIAGGLINQSYLVDGPRGRFVLQRLNPIFVPEIHANIAAVTERLAATGIATPMLVRADDGRLWAEHAGQVWRLYRYVDGVSFALVRGPEQARSAGELVGRFHAATAGLDHRFVGLRHGVHDTARHMAALEQAIAEHRAHRLSARVAELAHAILASYRALPPLVSLPLILGHGDLKISNVLFDQSDSHRAHCLIDLDTVGPIHLAHELGDMWRSWCNRAGEDDTLARLDLEVMDASFQGWLSGVGRDPSPSERAAALQGIEIISLELAARFAADALAERYFGWDRERFSGAGEHNLLRARGQFALHEEAIRTREERRRLLNCRSG